MAHGRRRQDLEQGRPGAEEAAALPGRRGVDANTAQILAIGPGRKSRIYRTTDGGATWDRTFTNKDQDAFYDCMAMYPDGPTGWR